MTVPFTPSASADSAIHAVSVRWQRHQRLLTAPITPSASTDSAIHAISVCWQRHQHLLTAPSASADSAIHAITVCWQRQSRHQHPLTASIMLNLGVHCKLLVRSVQYGADSRRVWHWSRHTGADCANHAKFAPFTPLHPWKVPWRYTEPMVRVISYPQEKEQKIWRKFWRMEPIWVPHSLSQSMGGSWWKTAIEDDDKRSMMNTQLLLKEWELIEAEEYLNSGKFCVYWRHLVVLK